MKTIILGAGKGERFKAEGFSKPKPLLPMPDGRTLLEWIIERLQPHDLAFIGRRPDSKAIQSKIYKIMVTPTSPNSFAHSWLDDKDTNSPLQTAWVSRGWITMDGDCELLISYCDLFPNFDIAEFLMACRQTDSRAGIVVFPSDNPRYGRTPDGELANSGIFYFSSTMDFVHKVRYTRTREKFGIPYIVWKYKTTETWEYLVGRDDIVDVGVPRDYKLWMAQQGSPVHDW